MLLRLRDDFYAGVAAAADEGLLLIEVSDSTLRFANPGGDGRWRDEDVVLGTRRAICRQSVRER